MYRVHALPSHDYGAQGTESTHNGTESLATHDLNNLQQTTAANFEMWITMVNIRHPAVPPPPCNLKEITHTCLLLHSLNLSHKVITPRITRFMVLGFSSIGHVSTRFKHRPKLSVNRVPVSSEACFQD